MSPTSRSRPETPAESSSAGGLQEILGYLNFSNGRPDAAFERRLNEHFAVTRTRPKRAATLRDELRAGLSALRSSSGAFADSAQAEAVIGLAFDGLLPAYRCHHADLLFHLPAEDFEQPLLVARMCEAVLQQGGPWDERDRIISDALDALNDYVGYRPVAVLENGRKMEPYPHERFRPVPLYVQGAGPATGRYHDLIARTIRFFEETPAEILQASHFELKQMEELALDVRAHDHLHPSNKRTNHMFGEWDPHQIDVRGRYRRFVVRKIILDALLSWMSRQHDIPPEEVLFDGAAVLCGTMLMASSIAGWGPGTFDSNVTLSHLLPKVARQRDAFYERLLATATGSRSRRLNDSARLTRQPFGHVRQQLNIELANYGARQVQYRHLAQLYARMGYAEESRREAALIPSTSVRFETEIRWRIAAVHQRLERSELAGALPFAAEIDDLLHRGIDCGALIDPWNILGFQGQYPLFQSREDSLPDQRAESLLELMEAVFGAFSRLLNEASAQGETEAFDAVSTRFGRLADEWDRYATTTVEDLPRVSGSESFVSATHVSLALGKWRAAGEAAGAISFWRQHVDQFQSAKSYALVVEALLQRKDHVASLGLLMQWLSQAEQVGLESGPYSFFALVAQWMDRVLERPLPPGERPRVWRLVRRLFDYIEANAGEYWSAPELLGGDLATESSHDPLDSFDDVPDEEDDPDDEDDDAGLFDAAYDEVIWRDTADDGHEGDTLDDHVTSPQNTEFEFLARRLEPRLRFLNTLADLWQKSAAALAGRGERDARLDQFEPVMTAWGGRIRAVEAGLARLLASVREYELAAPSGEFDSNVEFDTQFQTKLYLLHTIISTMVNFQGAGRALACCLPAPVSRKPGTKQKTSLDGHFLDVARAVFRREPAEVRRLFPQLLKQLARKPLLYVSLENGGEPDQVLEARGLQTGLRFLLVHLPSLGLVQETLQLLLTAFRMEHVARPQGQAVTEFDRLFRIGLHSTIEALCRASSEWRLPSFAGGRLQPRRSRRSTSARPGRIRPAPAVAPRSPSPGRSRAIPNATRRRLRVRRSGFLPSHLADWLGAPRERRTADRGDTWRNKALVILIGRVVDEYRSLWLKHSGTMRLSTVEAISQPAAWNEVREFISRYGHDLFHARNLMIGNVRAILHKGVDWFLEHLEENEDPLHPVRLLADLRDGGIDEDDAEHWIELILGAIVDKFDRFLEYNTTTTQSDYGEMLFCLLDFLRMEAAYDRDAWNRTPDLIVHETLTESGRRAAAAVWESLVREASTADADRHEKRLAEVEEEHGMKLPSLRDHIHERFVKPLAVNRMLALAPRAVEAARAGAPRSESFNELRHEIDDYLESTFGSGIDVPAWLRSLEREVDRVLGGDRAPRDGREAELRPAARHLTLRQARREVDRCRNLARESSNSRRT